jgi:hypothetical protein
MWYYDPTRLAIMQDCTHTEIGVWSDNALDRTVVVAVYGARPPHNHALGPESDT